MNARVKEAFRDAMIFTVLVTVLVSGLLFAARPLWDLLFQLDGEARTLVFLFAGPLSLAFFFNGVVFTSNAAFNNLNHPFYSTWVNWGRHTLGTIPFVIVGSAWFGASGVMIGQYAGGFVFAVIAYVLARRVMNVAGTPTEDPFARQARQHRLFNLRR